MARDPEKEGSVYDFLYIDGGRIVHFLSQFNQYGHLTALTKTAIETGSTAGGFNLHVAKADFSEGETNSLIKEYDAQWIAPLSFLDQAAERGLLSRAGLSAARIGNLMLISGGLAIFDLATMKLFWKLGPVKDALMQSFTVSSPGIPKQRIEANFKASMQMLESMPHALVASMTDGTSSVWATLKEDALVISPVDLMLKHGANIAGLWNIVGIIDAIPKPLVEAASTAPDASAGIGPLGGLIDLFIPHVQNMLGRPSTSYGITPLLIFREVKA